VTDVATRQDGETFYLSVEMIRVNHKKLRKLSARKIECYTHDYEGGDEFPPIRVDNCGGFYVIRDGRHRYQAQLNAGFAMIAVTLR
jgi:hypothetical protein